MNHSVISRPNSTAAFSALGVYLDVMRPFVVQHMPVHPGTAGPGALIRDALPLEMQPEFDKRIGMCDGDESLTIDVTHIPHIVKKNWQLSFAREFAKDRGYITKMEGLAKSRNLVCHPTSADISAQQAESVFHCVEKITVQIDREDARDEVLVIRQRLTEGCCADCPESHMRAEVVQHDEVEEEMRMMQDKLDALSRELSLLRGERERSSRPSIKSRLGRIVPRVGFSFSVSFGNNRRQEEVDVGQPGDVGVSQSENGHAVGQLHDLSSENGQAVESDQLDASRK